ncbi:MAG: SagB/ThcOx family dehydrogenase [Candidatus Caenarcaniphilales bacterium]|nr:SagB/ThcOx family dehydrogenase [Candidatus Caenarcaniphilales bacterium]
MDHDESQHQMALQIKTFAEFFHEQTKYHLGQLNDASKTFAHLLRDPQPSPFKEYSGGDFYDLSPYLPLKANPFSDAELIKASDWTEEQKPLAELSRILYFANGITAIAPYPPNPILMRAAPSAGALYPNEIYVITRNYAPNLPDGLYNFQVKTHSLAQISSEPDLIERLAEEGCFESELVGHTDLILVITAVFDRSTWRYQDRAYRRILLDTGHIIANIDLVAALFQRKACLLGGFNDDALVDLMRLDPSHEQVLYIMPLPSLTSPIAEIPYQPALPSYHFSVPENVPPGQQLLALHEISKIYDHMVDTKPPYCPLNSIERLLSGEELEAEPLSWTKCDLMTMIMSRRSARKFDPNAKVTKEQLTKILDFAFHPENYDLIDPDPDYLIPQFIRTYILVNNVEGLDVGVYLFEPSNNSLKQVRFKKLKQEAFHLCLNQSIAKDAAFMVIFTADLADSVNYFGDRAYRYLHTDPGNYGQRLYLAATKLGLGASGIGGFYDDIGNEILGISHDDIILYVMVFGVTPTEVKDDLES